MYPLIASALLNILLNFILIPTHGYMGAAVATLISYAFLLTLTILISRRFFIWKFPFKTLSNATCASAIMGTVVYYIIYSPSFPISLNMILGICIGVFTYAAFLSLFKEFQPIEKEAMKNLITKYLR
jgi:O-antigen/teichoic acid export membrane protein